ncbi:hypothetical protein E8E11_009165 [Didymella keratinophila]|nr:hypothetical protein E8E11_009165 [Didymella keratinophila]
MDASFQRSALYGTQGKVPTVVDLTADSDFESDDEATASAHTTAVNSKTPIPPSPRTSVASHVSIPAMGNSLSLSFSSKPSIDPAPPTRTEASHIPSGTMKPSTSRPASAMTTSIGRRASASTGNGQTQAAAVAITDGSVDAERGAKRRKLSTTSGKALVPKGLQVQIPGHSGAAQSSKPGTIAPTPARASPTVAAPTSLRAKLNNTNAAPSVSFMNTALKPSTLSIPVLDDMPVQAARPLFIGRLSHANTATGLLSPGLTSPESVSAMVLDSDPLEPVEVEVSQRKSPVLLESGERGGSGRSSSEGVSEPGTTFPASTPANAVQSQPTPRQPWPREAAPAIESTERNDGDNINSDLPLRQSIPREIQQTPSSAGSNSHAVSPASTPHRRGRPPQSRIRSAMDESDQLIIFLKEVKRLKWAEITKEYLKDYPQSNYGRIQSRYSSFLNKRDRTEDPPRLVLPSRFAAEATIDWVSVHANTASLRVKKEVADLGNADAPRKTHVEKRQAIPRAVKQIRDDADSSSGESPPQRHQSRRAAPVDYTWPQLRTVKGGFEELPDAEESAPRATTKFGGHSRSESPSDETPIITGRNRKLHAEPLDADFSQQDSKLGLELQRNSRSAQQERAPYLSSSQRLAMHESPGEWMWDQNSIQDWQGAILHVDLSPAELQTVKKVVAKFIPSDRQTRHSTYRRHLRAILKGLTEPKLQQLAHETSRHLRSRDIHSIRCFLEDAAAGKLSDAPQYFAAGAVAVTDSDSMQYNRPNVLMYGDTINDSIHELGKHYIKRPKTENGANSTHAMYVSQDPKLFTTVSSVAFSPSGQIMYSAGYDNSVCIWDVSAGSQQPYMIRELQHKASVDVLAVNPAIDGMIATGTKRTTDKSIKLVKFSEEALYDEPWEHTKLNFASTKAVSRPDLKMSANALKFDLTGQFLLAGFGANMREDSGFDTSGDICLWDVHSETTLQIHGSSRNVFDITFNPRPGYHGLFAVGCVANGVVNRGTRSVVRFYSRQKDHKFTCPLELECKALDMNDVVWCPHDENIFAAGCTDGRSYLWDLRRHNAPLCILEHGSSLMPLQDGVPHERTDTGVRFLSWGQNARRLYSGSSDGVVKVWDVLQSQEDVFVKDLITTNSGIMSGAFTSDYSKLVLGEVNGTANVLEVGRDDIALKDADKLSYHPYIDGDDDAAGSDMVVDKPLPERTNTPSAEAREWLMTGQLRLAPMGGLPKQQVIQGPNYEGPFDQNEDIYTQSLREEAFHFQQAMTIPKGPQCDLPNCADNINTTTYEDVGDSGEWEIGALGYECSQQPDTTIGELDVPALRRFGKDSYLEKLEDADTAFGDEMNALTDHYFGLAIDRPECPPL